MLSESLAFWSVNKLSSNRRKFLLLHFLSNTFLRLFFRFAAQCPVSIKNLFKLSLNVVSIVSIVINLKIKIHLKTKWMVCSIMIMLMMVMMQGHYCCLLVKQKVSNCFRLPVVYQLMC